MNTNPLPDDGDVIEFEKVPEGSLIPAPVVVSGAAVDGSAPPKRRYRVEHKPLDREYLLVDTVSGHAARVPAHEFKRAKWGLVTHETLDGEAKAAAEKEAEPSFGRPLDEGTESAPPKEGLLNLDPLPSTEQPTQ
jgi:hypothetical protein